MDRETLLDLIPAYAIGALDPDERAEVEAFLQADSEAQRLLTEYQSFSDALVLTVPARPAPAHLADDLRRRLAADRPRTLPPLDITKQAERQPPPARPALRRTPATWIPVAVGIAAAFVVAVIGLMLLIRPAPPDDPAALYQWIVAQADAQVLPVASDQGVTGELAVSSDGQTAVLRVANVPEVAPDRDFELWLVDENGAQSGGLINLQPSDTNYIVLPLEKPAELYNGFGVSVEPEGGSPDPAGPTGPRLFGVAI